MTEAQIRKALDAVHEQKARLNGLLDEAMRRKLLTCSHCERRTRVGDLVYIQTYYYVTPWGCTGGDYWAPGEGQYECPKCRRRNRSWNRPEIIKLQRYFKKIVKEHEH